MRFQDSWSYSFKVDLDDFSVEKYSCSKSFEHQLESLLSLGQAQEESLIPSCTCWEEPFPGDSIRYIGAGEVVVPGTDGSGTVGLSVPLRSLHWLQVMSYSQSQSQLPAGFVLTQPCWTATSWTVSGSLNTDLNDCCFLSHLATRPWEVRQSQEKVRMSALAAYESRSWTRANLLSLPPDSWPGYLGGMRSVCGDLDLAQIRYSEFTGGFTLIKTHLIN